MLGQFPFLTGAELNKSTQLNLNETQFEEQLNANIYANNLYLSIRQLITVLTIKLSSSYQLKINCYRHITSPPVHIKCYRHITSP